MLTFDHVHDRVAVNVDGVEYLVIVAVDNPPRRELILYCVDESLLVGLAVEAQHDVYWVTLPLDDRVVYTGNDVEAAIRWATLEDQL